jgi:NAD(P)-dependent dehydrogenase (short-subunit alcohol dehydrogenase family)
MMATSTTTHYWRMSPSDVHRERQVALVTGANKGIGYAIVEGLGRLGFTTLVGARDRERGDYAVGRLRSAGLDARFCAIDVRDAESVLAAAAAICGAHGRLDVLVNNAAVKLEFHPAPPSRTSIDVVRATYETNVFGTMRVIQTMLPLLLASAAPRIVNLSSGLGSLTLASLAGSKYQAKPMLGYNTAKAAVNALTVQFANEFRNTKLKVNAADPGYVRTDMTHNDGSRLPEQGAAVAIHLATLPDDGPTGGFFDENGPVPW